MSSNLTASARPSQSPATDASLAIMLDVLNISSVAAQTACKVCGHRASLYGVVDFNKNCEAARGDSTPLSGVPVYYHRCDACRLLFTTAFDAWRKDDYLAHIYNAEYVKFDPDYLEARPKQHAELMTEFLARAPTAKLLDYGGGNGGLAKRLGSIGFDASSWDPMDPDAVSPESGAFDIVTAFEVFEHTPTPVASLEELLSFCKRSAALVFFSTYTIDKLPQGGMDFWYIAPRNGHITIYTEKSLQQLFSRFELSVHHFGNGYHLAYRELPEWVNLDVFSVIHRRGRVRRYLKKLKARLRR